MRNYRILRVCAANPYIDLFTDFYQAHKLGELSYEEALQKYQESGNLIPGSWSLCMRQLGNESTDVIPDFMLLQRRWAEQNSVKINFNKSDWSVRTLLAQIAAIKPEVIFFYAGGFYTLATAIRKQIKAMFPFVKIVTGLWGDFLPSGYSTFNDLDLVFSVNNDYRDYMISAGMRSYLVGNCFDHVMGKLVEQEARVQPAYDFIFAGTSGYRFDDHRERYLDLIKLMENTNLQVWCWEPTLPPTRLSINFTLGELRDLARRVLGKVNIDNLERVKRLVKAEGDGTILSRLINDAIKTRKGQYCRDWWHNRKPFRELFPSRCRPPVLTGLEYYRLLKDAKIVLNRHRDEKADYANIRSFEVTGVGSCLLTDRGKEMAQFFVPDEEIVTYLSIDECIEKVSYLLDHESVRMAIGRRGKARTLKDHTVMNRCQQIDEVLQKII